MDRQNRLVVQLTLFNDHYRRLRKQPAGQGGTDAMRQLGRVPDGAAISDDVDDAALAESEETFIVQRTLQLVRTEFRENTWKSFQRTAIDGLNATEVAEELGMSPSAVRKAPSRVTQRLEVALRGYVDIKAVE